MKNMKKGYDEMTGLYTSRYYAKTQARGDEVVVKVCGGYTIMSASQYNVWKKKTKVIVLEHKSPARNACRTFVD